MTYDWSLSRGKDFPAFIYRLECRELLSGSGQNFYIETKAFTYSLGAVEYWISMVMDHSDVLCSTSLVDVL